MKNHLKLIDRRMISPRDAPLLSAIAFAKQTVRLSQQVRALHRALCAGRQLGRARAHARAEARRFARPDLRDRQPARRGQHDRHRCRGESDAGRLHDHPVRHAAHDQSEHPRESALRSGEGFRADHDRRRVADVSVRESLRSARRTSRSSSRSRKRSRGRSRSLPAARARRRISPRSFCKRTPASGSRTFLTKARDPL